MLAATISSVEYLQIISQVKDFYETSWVHLITIITIALTLVGIIFPLLMQWIQQRTFNIKETELKKYSEGIVSKEIEIMKSQINNVIESKFVEAMKNVDVRFGRNEEKIQSAMGGLFQIQSHILFEEKNYIQAYYFLVKAAISHVKCKNDDNLLRVLNILITESIPRLSRQQIDDVSHERGLDINSLIQLLEKHNTNGTYTDSIVKIKRAIRELK